MTQNYLNIAGFKILWTNIKNKLDSKANQTDIPTKTSNLTNDSGYITADALAPYAKSVDVPNAQVQADWNETDETSKAYIANKPTDLATKAEVEKAQTTADEAKEAVAKVVKFNATVVDALPATGEVGTIYLVADTHSDSNDSYDEYLWIESISKFEKIGNTDIDLSGYAKADALTETNANVTTAQTTADNAASAAKKAQDTADTKANAADDYTKVEVNTELEKKINTDDIAAIPDDTIQAIIDGTYTE